MVRLAVDLMGSDLGPGELAKGLREFLEKHGDAEAVVFGKGDVLDSLLTGVDRVEKRAVDSDPVPMEVSPFAFLRQYRDSSMFLACDAAGKDEGIDGVVSSGSTGGFLTGCHTLVGRIKGVAREGLAAPFVTAEKGKQTLILDVGASNYCTAEELVCFARMGQVYARQVFGRKEPKVYLLSNGTEEGKGLKETVEAYFLLRDKPYFGGLTEARDALDGTKDVIVTTGYPGNIFLKATEGTAQLVMGLMKKAFTRSLRTKIGYLLAKPGLKEMKSTMDYRSTGGAVLLGVKKVAVKAHGNSNAYAFYNALRVAYEMVQNGLVPAVERELTDAR